MSWEVTEFSDIQKDDRLKFLVQGYGSTEWRYATARQPTVINDWYFHHKETQYVNVLWDDPFTPYTTNWEHGSDTVYAPNHKDYPYGFYEERKESLFGKKFQTGHYILFYREKKEVSNIENAKAKIAEAEAALTQARKDLEAAQVDPKKELKERLDRVNSGTVIQLKSFSTSQLFGSIHYMKKYASQEFVNDLGQTLTTSELADKYFDFIVKAEY